MFTEVSLLSHFSRQHEAEKVKVKTGVKMRINTSKKYRFQRKRRKGERLSAGDKKRESKDCEREQEG